jgi:hypothetical protein
MRKILLSVFVLCLLAGPLSAQEKVPVFLSLETGADIIDNGIRDLEFIRQSASDYDYYGDYAESISGLYYSFFTGIKEEFTLSSRISITTGLRYTHVHSSIGDSNSDRNKYMYLLLSSSGTTTEFLKATSIRQDNDYLGIPIEFRYYISHYHFFRSYLRMGAVINYRIQTKTDIVCANDAMAGYEKELTDRIEKPNSFYSIAYGGFGVRFGKEYGPSLNIEAHVPSVIITPYSSTLTDANIGSGIEITLQIPLNSKTKQP